MVEIKDLTEQERIYLIRKNKLKGLSDKEAEENVDNLVKQIRGFIK